NEIETVFIRQHHIGDDETALARRDPPPQSRGGSRGAHVVARAAQCLIENRADRRVAIGNQDASRWHYSSSPSAAAFGNKTRKIVFLGIESHSITPPWSPMIFATNARPRPEPRVFVVTNGSKMCGMRSAGTPEPLSRTVTSSGRLSRSPDTGALTRTPGR